MPVGRAHLLGGPADGRRGVPPPQKGAQAKGSRPAWVTKAALRRISAPTGSLGRDHRRSRMRVTSRRGRLPRPGRRFHRAVSGWALPFPRRRGDPHRRGDDRVLRGAHREVSHHLHRRPAERGRVGRLEGSHASSATGAARGRRLFVTNTKRLGTRHPKGRAATASSLKSIRSARSPKHSMRSNGEESRLHGRDLPPLGRDRRCDDCGHRRRDQRRPDQDRRASRPIGSPNTTSSSASSRNWLTWPSTRATRPSTTCARDRGHGRSEPGGDVRAIVTPPGPMSRMSVATRPLKSAW